jgi:hypothetical protein
MIEMLRIYSNGFLENVTIEELTPWFPWFFKVFFSIGLFVFSLFIPKIIKKLRREK